MVCLGPAKLPITAGLGAATVAATDGGHWTVHGCDKGRQWTALSLQQHAAATIDDATDMIQLLCHDTRTQQLPKRLLDYVTDVPNLAILEIREC